MVEDRPRLMAQLLFATCEQFHPGEVETAQKTLLKNILQKLLSLATNSEKIAEQSNKFNEYLYTFYSDDSPGRVHEIVQYFTTTPDPHILNKEESKLKQSMTRFVDPLHKYELFGIESKGIVPEISLYSEPKEGKYYCGPTIYNTLKLTIQSNFTNKVLVPPRLLLFTNKILNK
jgi:hypothetical protein